MRNARTRTREVHDRAARLASIYRIAGAGYSTNAQRARRVRDRRCWCYPRSGSGVTLVRRPEWGRGIAQGSPVRRLRLAPTRGFHSARPLTNDGDGQKANAVMQCSARYLPRGSLRPHHREHE